jgi:hypothetical protein
VGYHKTHDKSHCLYLPFSNSLLFIQTSIYTSHQRTSFQLFFGEVITNWGQEVSAFEQNIDPSDLGRPGQAVTLAWEPRHSFVLDSDDDLTAGLDTSWDE